MGVLYGLLAALTWGSADFLARLSAGKVGARRTLLWMQAVGTLCMGALLAFPFARPHALSAHVLLFAAGIGVLNVTGGLLLYRALEIGTVSLVSPISSTFAAITALLAIATGERPGPAQLIGLALTAAGVIGASIPPRSGGTASGAQQASRRGIGLAALAALSWGLGFFALRYVVGELGSFFPVFVSRVVSTAMLASGSLALGLPLSRPRGAWRLVVGIALLDSAAFALYNAGIAASLTAVVSILSSLFSAVTVVLALLFLKERMSALQWVAVALTLAGVALVSSGS